MAVRGWGGSVAIAIGVAAGAGAAQLGLGYGLGIIAWLPSASGTSEASWVASLAWAAWIAATSTVAGAIAAQRIGAPESVGPTGRGAATSSSQALTGGLWRVALALASAVGGLVTVALVAVPARAATRADSVSPQSIAAGYAVIGVMLGLVVAIWSLSSPAVASNVITTSGWLWLLAIIAVVDGVLSGRGLASAQLGVWQITSDSERFWFRDYFYWPGAALSLGSALVIGALAARSTARLPERRVGAVVSGVAGPLLVAAAYFLAAPRLVGIRAEQVSAHLAAPYAVIAGLAGSALVAALAQRGSLRRAERADPTAAVKAEQEESGRVPQQRTAAPDDRASEPDVSATRSYDSEPTSPTDALGAPAWDKPSAPAAHQPDGADQPDPEQLSDPDQSDGPAAPAKTRPTRSRRAR
ncbi:hypothetical protein BDK92_3556 [Micromonospora pisi]|uniref:Uncharacterized protein n=1 Tax=Micromonospora pisi TaxID=589240 RepID=A0A495JJM2_9ACTN|nr:hypothetical protein [Micromonospora pisi]RKR89216.1 hypothetical protein BDK92_3556 [Micromonospora pisi]